MTSYPLDVNSTQDFHETKTVRLPLHSTNPHQTGSYPALRGVFVDHRSGSDIPTFGAGDPVVSRFRHGRRCSQESDTYHR